MSLPTGFRLSADPGTRAYVDGRVLLGGSPRRALRLTAEGADVVARLLDGQEVATRAEAALARRLLDAGMAHPVPPAVHDVDIEVVVPVFGDPTALSRCLTALARCLTALARCPAAPGGTASVTVVDDGSPEPEAIARVVRAHGARLVRLDANLGPAAARNAGWRAATAEVVAFVDADVQADIGALRAAAAHFTDPVVAAVAPRVRPAAAGGRALTAFAEAFSPLDLGARPGLVTAAGRVAYVPSATLLVRRSVLAELGGFDEALRYGEDVDLVWRLGAAGRQVRYDPTVQVRHDEPTSWPDWLRRRHRYGTSAAALARRHGSLAAPLVVAPAPAATMALVTAGRPEAGLLVAAGSAFRLNRRLRAADVPAGDATRAAVAAPIQVAVGACRWLGQLWWPAVALSATRSRRARLVALTALTTPALVEWATRRPRLDPARWTMAMVADDISYGLGVWRGCVRERTLRPVLPRLTRRTPPRSTTRHDPAISR